MPEITKTREQLIERAATELGALTSGQSLTDEDSDTIENLIDPLIRSLAFDNVVSIDDTDAIPAEFFIQVAMLLANVAMPSFGQQFNPGVKLEQERQLRRLTATRPTNEPVRSLYY